MSDYTGPLYECLHQVVTRKKNRSGSYSCKVRKFFFFFCILSEISVFLKVLYCLNFVELCPPSRKMAVSRCLAAGQGKPFKNTPCPAVR